MAVTGTVWRDRIYGDTAHAGGWDSMALGALESTFCALSSGMCAPDCLRRILGLVAALAVFTGAQEFVFSIGHMTQLHLLESQCCWTVALAATFIPASQR